jgi:hypothetical protein
VIAEIHDQLDALPVTNMYPAVYDESRALQ